MPRSLRRLLAALLALTLLVLGLLLTVTQWLPRLAGIWLPADTRIVLEGSPRWRNGGLWFPQVRYLAGECALASVEQVSLGWHDRRWRLAARQVTLDSDCLQQLPQSEQPGTPKSLAAWQQLLPGADIQLDNLTIAPWQAYAGRFDLSLTSAKQTLRYRGDNLNIDASLQGQQLNVEQLTLRHKALPQPVTLHGRFELPEFANGLPIGGQLEGELQYAGEPLRLTLDWQQQQGKLALYTTGDGQPLLTLPWQADARQIRIVKGRYRWPTGEQTLSGFLDLRLDNWRQGLEETQIAGRLNVLTQGRGGKGNAVLNIGPGRLSMTNSALPLRLTGESKLAAMQLYAALPGDLSGPLLDPQLRFQPGALLRLRGRLLSTLEVDEARWPLAGVRLASQGIDGRLQAILKAHDPSFGQFRLHLDGRASNFWPDKGEWKWRYWGSGDMRPLNAAWTIQGAGGWRDTLIHLDSLNAGFNQMQYGMAQVMRPRLTLSAPVNWQRDAQRPAFNGGFRIDAGETRFDFGGRLPASSLRFEAKGQDPSHFIWRGALQAQAIGPLRVHGRWDGERLRGEAWWPTQSLRVFQPLLNPDLKMKIRAGELRAQVAFSAAAKEGFRAGGHWTVTQGSLWTSDNQINGVDFSLPFRLKDQQWQLGVRGPVQLRIGEITNQFAMQDIRADLQGYYPWSEARPLTLQAVSMALLGGKVTLPALRLPQHQAATLSLRDISLSKLVTALKPKQFAMSGRINGELPLWVNNPRWLVQNGWIANSGALTFRMDKDMADAITAGNVAAGAAMDWLRYMEISRSWATLNLDNLGNLAMQAQVQGVSQFSNRKQTVNLNYRHQQNLFQLWRSLRFGDNLQSWVEQNATLPTKRDQQP